MFKINIRHGLIVLAGIVFHSINYASFDPVGNETLATQETVDGQRPDSRFISFTGNAFQRQLFTEIIDIINRSGKTLVEWRDNATIVAYLEATSHTCITALEMIRYSTPFQAVAWTDLAHDCEQATNIAKDTACGDIQDFTNTILNAQQLMLRSERTLNFFLKSDKDNQLLERVWKEYQQFSQFPVTEQAEYAPIMLRTFIAMPTQSTRATLVLKALKSIHRVTKIEAATLQRLASAKQENTSIIKGIPVPERLAPAIEKLVTDGKIITGEEVTRWVRLLSAPLSSSLANAIVAIMEPRKKLAELMTFVVPQPTSTCRSN